MPNITGTEQIEYLKELRVNIDELTGEMENFAFLNKIPILDWKASEFLQQLVKIKEPTNVLEIGTAIGYSTIMIAKNLSENSIIDTIELSRINVPLARRYIERSGLSGKINIIEGDALKVIPELDKKYDFIFLDSDKEDYLALFNEVLPKLNTKGILFVDNLLWKGNIALKEIPEKFKKSASIIKEFNRKFCSNEILEAKIYPIGDGVGVGIKK
ncbi:MAG: O-methyltransferase [Ignavibacteria bacterium]|nr:O-methyltransferase [Ignavibacteria bacterium]